MKKEIVPFKFHSRVFDSLVFWNYSSTLRDEDGRRLLNDLSLRLPVSYDPQKFHKFIV
jgi:hypothetical protein